MKPLPMKRWMAEISYRNGRETDIVTFEEIGTPRIPPRAGMIRHLIEDHGVPKDEASAVYEDLCRRISEARREPSLADIIETGTTIPDREITSLTIRRGSLGLPATTCLNACATLSTIANSGDFLPNFCLSARGAFLSGNAR